MGHERNRVLPEEREGLHGRKSSSLYRPTREAFHQLASDHNLIAVWREAEADLETPISAFIKLNKGPYSFLLESVERAEQWGRFSILGFEPSLVISSRGGRVEHVVGEKVLPVSGENPVRHFFQMLEAFRPAMAEINLPFTGGAVGYFSYDLLPFLEKIEFKSVDALSLPEMMFMFSEKVVIFDHPQNRLYLVVNIVIPSRCTPLELDSLYDSALLKLEEMAFRLRKPLNDNSSSEVFYLSPELDFQGVTSNKGKEEFMGMVERAIDYIHAGEAFQIVLSQRFQFRIGCEPFEVYRALRTENPSPYMFFIKFDDFYLVGSSPEPLVRRRGNTATIRPIAGTRRRGKNLEEDGELEQELRADEKERAEHMMLVDLARNDLGRVCRPGSVRVEKLMEVERYSQVMHLVSEVKGEVPTGVVNLELLRASFPAGTVSGAPKLRACQIIDELEGERRGVYAGAIGYMSYGGDLDTCIAIRTLVLRGREAYLQAGAGIVADSLPENEYLETVVKARAVLRAARKAEALRGERH